MAIMKSFVSVGETTADVSTGVGGYDGAIDDVGVGRVGSLVGGAMGRVSDSRLGLREADDAERDERVKLSSSGRAGVRGGGGGIDSKSEVKLDSDPSCVSTGLATCCRTGGATLAAVPAFVVIVVVVVLFRSAMLERRRI
jgi:hypothetical protein